MTCRSLSAPGIAVIVAIAASSPLAADVILVPSEVATIQDAIAFAVDGDEIQVAPGDYMGTVDFLGKRITLNAPGGPEVTTIHGPGPGAPVVRCTSAEPVGTKIRGFTITGGNGVTGGGVEIRSSSLAITGCVITDNTAEIAAGVYCLGGDHIVVEDTVVRDNIAAELGGVYIAGYSDFVVRDCHFIENAATSGGGGALFIGGATGAVINSRFAGNSAGFFAGAFGTSSNNFVDLLNCVFVLNECPRGALYLYGTINMDFCTVSNNIGAGVMHGPPATVFISHSVIYDNSGGSIVPEPSFGPGMVTVVDSSVEESLDAPDPYHVQPGAYDLRLGDGSLCVDAVTGGLPADTHDVDRDGDVLEELPLDGAGESRVAGVAPDYGALEGSSSPMPAAAIDLDIDQGEISLLSLDGAPFDPLTHPVAMLFNTSGPDNSTVCVEAFSGTDLPPAGGHDPVADGLDIATSIGDGAFALTVMIPLAADDLGGADPFDLEMAYLDASTGDWNRAIDGNAGPEGERVEVLGPGPLGITQGMGDHGVYWVEATGTGMVWANVDHSAPFIVGLATGCPADATGDQVVDTADLVYVILAWGSADPDADINGDGVVNVSDLVLAIEAWGDC